jgi:molybdopterin converting factor small subunit
MASVEGTGALLLFGKFRDVFGASSLPLPPGADTVAALRAKLIASYPEHHEMLAARSTRFAVNQDLVSDERAARIVASDEVAMMPPLSGG